MRMENFLQSFTQPVLQEDKDKMAKAEFLKQFKLTNAIQTLGLSVLFFVVFLAAFKNNEALKYEMKNWDNTKIKPVVMLSDASNVYNRTVTETELSGMDKTMEDECGANCDVISPEAQILMDIKESLGGEIGIACVDSYVNVRVEPNAEAEQTAKIYDSSVVFIQEDVGDWFKIKSGNAEGYVMKQFFLYGDHLAKQILLDEPYTREELIEDKSFTVGITLEEEEAIRLAKEEEERKERERIAAEQEAARKKAMAEGNSYSYENTTELRKQICDYACQFVGLKYINGGNSLVTGTDCSGFTKLIYANFGYGLDRTPAGQYNNNGRLVSYAEAQPGDVIIYGKNGVCTHAALYLGDGKIIHAANSRQNTYIGNATYNTIMGVKNIID